MFVCFSLLFSFILPRLIPLVPLVSMFTNWGKAKLGCCWSTDKLCFAAHYPYLSIVLNQFRPRDLIRPLLLYKADANIPLLTTSVPFLQLKSSHKSSHKSNHFEVSTYRQSLAQARITPSFPNRALCISPVVPSFTTNPA